MLCRIAPALLLFASVAHAQQGSVPLYTDLGTHHRAISTKIPRAQQYFDQGLRLVYGFNHAEAIRSFTRAGELDPSCAICWWGVAYAYGPHVNAGMDSASGAAAYRAAQKALTLSGRASRWEHAWVHAVAARYGPNPTADRAKHDSAYAKAMATVAAKWPADLDAAALYAESMMDLRPWNYWTPDGKPYPGTTEIVRQLERVIAANPQHPGACHYYIHAVEAVNPRAAVPCAERLAQLMPGVGHMVHMPAHIYVRVGRYADAAQSNVHAIHTDEQFIEGQKQTTLYSLGYYPHNIHFLAFVSAMSGQSAKAIESARALKAKVNLDVARQAMMLQEMVPYYALTLTTFGRWGEVLAEPLPPSDLRFPMAMAQYARGVAYAASGRMAEARIALDTVLAIDKATPAGAEAKAPVSIAVHALLGEIASRGGNHEAAVAHFAQALTIEDAGLYFEPPKWYYPIRQSLGAALLKVGRNADAEAVYREDLKRFPENGWSLFGLAEALKTQGKSEEASSVEKRLAVAWANADVKLVASRF